MTEQSLDPRERVASVLELLARGEMSLQNAQNEIAQIDAPWEQQDLDEAFHFVQHFVADEDIRGRDASYAAAQVDTLRAIAARLRRNRQAK